VDVTFFGAVGDGVHDDRPAIQAAIDFASPGCTVWIPAGTYLLDSRAGSRAPDGNPRAAVLMLPSDVSILGEGDQSVLKLGDGMNDCLDPVPTDTSACGGYHIFHHEEGNSRPERTINNITLSSFRIDGNAAGNPVPPNPLEIPNYQTRGAAVMIRFGDNIIIDDMTFENINGRQVVHIGNNGVTDQLTNFAIRNSRFFHHAQDPNINDHSSVYSVGDGGFIEDNVFTNSPLDNGFVVATAIELHGNDTLVQRNQVKHYRVGANIAATRRDQRDSTFFDNDFLAVRGGFAFWAVPPWVLSGMTLRDNLVKETAPNKKDHLVTWRVVFSPIEDLLIEGNTFTSILSGIDPVNPRQTVGIQIAGYAKNLTIRNNVISRTACEGIRVGGPEVPPVLEPPIDTTNHAALDISDIIGLTIEDNIIRDAGSWGTSTSESCMSSLNFVIPTVDPDYEAREIEIFDNRIRYDWALGEPHHPPTVVHSGIRLRGRLANVDIFNNEVLDDIAPDVKTGNAHFSALILHHSDPDSMDAPGTLGIQACPGSSWANSADSFTKAAGSSCNDSNWNLDSL